MLSRYLEKTVVLLSWVMAWFLMLCVFTFVGYLLFKGVPAISQSLFFGDTKPLQAILGQARVFDGIFPAMMGTLVLVVLSCLFAIPLGIFSGIYLAEYANPKLKALLGGFFDILAGIPSIVVGLFGFSLAIFLHHEFSNNIAPCLLISALALAVLVLPYIVKSTQASLENLPLNLRRTAYALGATKIQNIFYVLLPNAISGISSGVFLAIGRCAEDTAVILLTGVVAQAGMPSSLFAQFEALPFYIFYISNQYSDQAELAQGYGACLTLLAITGVLFMLAYALKRSLTYKSLFRA